MCSFFLLRMESILAVQTTETEGVGKKVSPKYNWELIAEERTMNYIGQANKTKLKCKQTEGLLHTVSDNK